MAEFAGAFSMWVIYDHPTDYPNSFVSRRWVAEDIASGKLSATDDVLVSHSLDNIRHKVRTLGRMNVKIAKRNDDDPKIVEIWI